MLFHCPLQYPIVLTIMTLIYVWYLVRKALFLYCSSKFRCLFLSLRFSMGILSSPLHKNFGAKTSQNKTQNPGLYLLDLHWIYIYF